ncbi:MAG TPA: patatin-like phospholipase family protein [Stellaceae bacterium]
MEFPRVAVLTIQGGGAVAIDLIGQLKGLTGARIDNRGAPTGDVELLPAAVAGTSAGAIIATLFWAGYTPEQIRDEVVRLFAPGQINAFFGRGRLFPGIRSLGIRFSGFARLVASLTALTGIRLALAYLFWPGGSWRRLLFPVWWAIRLTLTVWTILLTLPAALIGLVRGRGIFPGDGMVQAVDKLLRASPLLSPHHHGFPQTGLLRFCDVATLPDAGGLPPLFLIVTDVRRADLAIISSIDPDCSQLRIAEAARASAGFPGFFQAIRLSDRLDTCVDGGVISNFPAWIFGRQYREVLRRSTDPQLKGLAYVPWLHVGLRLPQDANPDPYSFQGFVRALVGLLLGRARLRLEDKLAELTSVKRRTVEPALPPPGAAPAGVLDFAALASQALVEAAFERGRINGRQAIEPDCFAVPPAQDITPILSDIAMRGAKLLQRWLVPESPVRCNIFLPDEETEELVLAYQVNMTGDPDEHLRLVAGEGISWLVYLEHRTVIADL